MNKLIEFTSLYEATQFVSKCPLCNGNIDFHDLSVKRTIGDFYSGGFVTTIAFNLSNTFYTDIIRIILETGKVTREIREEYVTDPVDTVRLHGAYPLMSGNQYLGLGMGCKHCHNYNFMLQVIVDLAQLVITCICLNSESVVFYKPEGMYEIRNAYTMGETEYYFSAEPAATILSFGKRQKLPLITLDRLHPEKTLTRVKNLLIFT